MSKTSNLNNEELFTQLLKGIQTLDFNQPRMLFNWVLKINPFLSNNNKLPQDILDSFLFLCFDTIRDIDLSQNNIHDYTKEIKFLIAQDLNMESGCVLEDNISLVKQWIAET